MQFAAAAHLALSLRGRAVWGQPEDAVYFVSWATAVVSCKRSVDVLGLLGSRFRPRRTCAFPSEYTVSVQKIRFRHSRLMLEVKMDS
ncbi:hypothetical protein I7I48_06650 [Histoplasma ohiense]|nr:hypothetical protein I7I48_06650 [Histoplasma ohiense (nom. inval.)]